MRQALSRILLLCFCLLFVSGYSQDQKEPVSEKKVEEKRAETQEDFFDNVKAPMSYKGAFVKMMLTLLAIIALIVISVWMLRRVARGRMRQMNYGRTIKIIERRPLSAKSVLYLVEIAGKKVVIAESQLEVRTITTADELPTTED